MLEKLLNRFLVELFPFLLNTLGLGLLLFVAIWAVYAVAVYYRQRRWAALAVLPVIGVALLGFLYLTASNTSRRAYIDLPMYELVRSLLNVIAAAVLACGMAWGVHQVAQRASRGRARGYVLVTSGVSLALMLAISAFLYQQTFQPDLDQITSEAPEVSNLTLVDNIPVRVFEDQVVRLPTAMTLGADDELYVAGNAGTIWVMRDLDQDGAADEVSEFATGLRQPQGLAWSPQGLYVTVLEQVLRLTDNNGDGRADETQVIVDGLPGEEYAFHQPHGLTFGPDGRLYVGVGSTTDHRPETHPWAARIFSVNPDGTDRRVYATGLRNPFNIIPAPGGGFFAIDNGSSGCIDTATQIDDCSHKIDVPEELNYIVEGGDYGFPNYFGVPPQDSGTLPPIVTFPDHAAPTGLLLYHGERLPAKYQGQLFMMLWATGEIYSIRVFRTDDTHFVGASRLFASGFVGPSALLEAPDGGLYVASFSSNIIHYIGRGETTRTGTALPSATASLADLGGGPELFQAACASCHGPDARGIEGVSKTLVGSEFVAGLSDEELVAFIKKGRDTKDPANATGIAMPALGGHADLTDAQVFEIARYLHTLQADQ